jgi:hypothetical protein
MPYFYPGDTVTLGVGDLTLNKVPVTTGATATIQLFHIVSVDPEVLVQVGTDLTGVVSGNDWTIDVNLPASPQGRYVIKTTAVKSGATWHGKRDDLWIRSF